MSSQQTNAPAQTGLWLAIGAIVVAALGYIPILYFSLIMGIVAGVAAIAAIVLGIVALRRGSSRGVAITAIVLGAVGLALAGGTTLWGALLFGLSQG